MGNGVDVELDCEQAASANAHSANTITIGILLRIAPIITGFTRRATPEAILPSGDSLPCTM